MRAMILSQLGPVSDSASPLRLVDWPTPHCGPHDLLVRVAACGVCHTELDEIEGRAAPARLPIILGHEVVGHVADRGPGVTDFQIGDRVGIGWIHESDGSEYENLSPQFRATGRDVDGGYAEYMTVPARYACAVPAALSDTEAAPLLCAGSVGYRALRLAGIRDGDPLGFTGFGGSAHLVLPMARHLFPQTPIFVFARDASERAFARELGAHWAGDSADRAPQPLAAIIDTTPAWKPVVEALANLRPGGRLVINALRKQDSDKSELLHLQYERHLWLEREIKTVANVTHRDLRECLTLAAEIPLRPHVQVYPLEEANRALSELKQGRIRGAKVLAIAGHEPATRGSG